MSDSESSAFDKAIASFECMTHEGREYLRICSAKEVFQKKGKNIFYSLDSGKALGSNARLKTYHVFELDGSIWLEKPEKLTPLWLRNF